MTTSSSKGSAKADQNIRTSETPASAASWLQMLSQWNLEIVSLYGKRMRECSMFPLSMMLCTSPDDVADAQEKFSETLLADYRAAAEKLTRAIGADASKVRGNEANEAYAAALLKGQEDARNILDQARAHAMRIIEDAQGQNAQPQNRKDQIKAA
jgi:hypothetical protein